MRVLEPRGSTGLLGGVTLVLTWSRPPRHLPRFHQGGWLARQACQLSEGPAWGHAPRPLQGRLGPGTVVPVARSGRTKAQPQPDPLCPCVLSHVGFSTHSHLGAPPPWGAEQSPSWGAHPRWLSGFVSPPPAAPAWDSPTSPPGEFLEVKGARSDKAQWCGSRTAPSPSCLALSSH